MRVEIAGNPELEFPSGSQCNAVAGRAIRASHLARSNKLDGATRCMHSYTPSTSSVHERPPLLIVAPSQKLLHRISEVWTDFFSLKSERHEKIVFPKERKPRAWDSVERAPPRPVAFCIWKARELGSMTITALCFSFCCCFRDSSSASLLLLCGNDGISTWLAFFTFKPHRLAGKQAGGHFKTQRNSPAKMHPGLLHRPSGGCHKSSNRSDHVVGFVCSGARPQRSKAGVELVETARSW